MHAMRSDNLAMTATNHIWGLSQKLIKTFILDAWSDRNLAKTNQEALKEEMENENIIVVKSFF